MNDLINRSQFPEQKKTIENEIFYIYTNESVFGNLAPYIRAYPDSYNDKLILHSHEFIEFVFVESGFSLHSFNGRTTVLMPGDLFAIGLNNFHSYFASNKKIYDILFDLNEISDIFNQIIGLPGLEFLGENAKDALPLALVNVEIGDRHELMRLIVKMCDELINRCVGWEIAMKSNLLQFLVMYSRFFQNSKNLRSEPRGGGYLNYIYKSLGFIEENYSKDISSNDIAHHAGISAGYLTQQFKSKFNISPSEYLRRFKIAKALELIISTDRPIHLIATECGFDSLSFFSRVFKQIMGNPPMHYRKK